MTRKQKIAPGSFVRSSAAEYHPLGPARCPHAPKPPLASPQARLRASSRRGAEPSRTPRSRFSGRHWRPASTSGAHGQRSACALSVRAPTRPGSCVVLSQYDLRSGCPPQAHLRASSRRGATSPRCPHYASRRRRWRPLSAADAHRHRAACAIRVREPTQPDSRMLFFQTNLRSGCPGCPAVNAPVDVSGPCAVLSDYRQRPRGGAPRGRVCFLNASTGVPESRSRTTRTPSIRRTGQSPSGPTTSRRCPGTSGSGQSLCCSAIFRT